MLVISALVGVFDGLGLTMFIPMFESVAKGVSNAQLGKLSFLSNFFQILGLEVNLYTALLIMLFFHLKRDFEIHARIPNSEIPGIFYT